MRKTHIKNFDALRAIAFLCVFVSHMFIYAEGTFIDGELLKWSKMGIIGVDFFFVLSGFLITWIAINNSDKIFSFRLFIKKRILRILPLYLLMVLIGYLLNLLSAHEIIQPINNLPSIGYYLFFVSNFYNAYFDHDYLFFLVILWSIAVEMQFYFFWGLILKFFRNRLLFFIGMFIGISLLFKCYFLLIEPDSKQVYFNFFSVMGDFGIGAFFAYAVVQKHHWIKLILNKKFLSRQLIYFLTLGLISLNFFCSNPVFNIFSKYIVLLLFGLILILLGFSTHNKSPKKNSILGKLGKISYGMYCYHGLVVTIAIKLIVHFDVGRDGMLSLLVYPFLMLLMTLILSALSYRFFEGVFLSLKDKMQ